MKKTIGLLVVLAVVFVPIFLFIHFAHSNTNSVSAAFLNYPEDSNASHANYYLDAGALVDAVESTHPLFELGEIPLSYEETKDQYLTYTLNDMTLHCFYLATEKYLASLGDGHMGLGDNGNRYIDIGWYAQNNTLYLLDANGLPSDEFVTRIGGVDVTKIMKQVDTFHSAENDTAKQTNYIYFCGQADMLTLSGVAVGDSVEISTNKRDFAAQMILSGGAARQYTKDYDVKTQAIGDVFYIDLGSFVSDTAANDIANVIRNARDKGTTEFIVDVRDNPGGYIQEGEKLLNALGMSAPRYGVYICDSALYRQQPRDQVDSRFFDLECAPQLDMARQNSQIHLVVLTDANTFSAATMFAVYVQDGKLGTVVGQPSSNAPTCYSAIVNYQMPVSGLTVPISTCKFYRPDVSADQQTMTPDVVVPYGEDALQKALEILQSE